MLIKSGQAKNPMIEEKYKNNEKPVTVKNSTTIGDKYCTNPTSILIFVW